MDLTNLLGTVLVLSMIALLAAKAAPPIAAKLEGQQALEVPLKPMYKLLAMRMSIISLLAVLILGSGFVGERWISHGMFIFAVVAVIGLLLFPMRYRFTNQGVSPNRATFRRWTEFTDWAQAGNVVYLKGTNRPSSLKLYLGDQDREAVLKLVRKYVRVAA